LSEIPRRALDAGVLALSWWFAALSLQSCGSQSTQTAVTPHHNPHSAALQRRTRVHN